MKIISLILLGGVCLVALGLFGRQAEFLWQQHRALSYATTEGTVKSSQVSVSYGSKGRIHYHVRITYVYTVDGQGYTGGRYRYDGHPDSNGQASAIVSAHPVNSTVPVYYDLKNPADALLSAGEDAEDVYSLFLIAPLCVLVLGVLRMTYRESYPGKTSPVAGGVTILSDTSVTRVRLPRFQPWSGAVVVAGVLSFVAAGAMFFNLVPGAPLATGGFLLVILLLGGAAAYGWQYRNIRSGKQDLVIDFGVRTVQLPHTYKRREAITVPFADIRQVALQRVWHNRRRNVYYTYLVTLEMNDGTLQRLIDLNEVRAESLAGWLNQQFEFEAKAPVLGTEV